MDINKREELLSELRRAEVIVQFTKADGTQRNMHCTLQEKYVPKADADAAVWGKDKQICTVWDIDEDSWRAFNFDRVNNWYIAS